jgi:hypothetical protein
LLLLYEELELEEDDEEEREEELKDRDIDCLQYRYPIVNPSFSFRPIALL